MLICAVPAEVKRFPRCFAKAGAVFIVYVQVINGVIIRFDKEDSRSLLTGKKLLILDLIKDLQIVRAADEKVFDPDCFTFRVLQSLTRSAFI
ncbi:MAG: hypothetical protein ABIN91_07645 [Mucilaginibacter sp.]|uniref:hypothetical protein n=1 Tax=Mucilaginibacter sp. TaxID=1882438 RepID=UPI003263D8D8